MASEAGSTPDSVQMNVNQVGHAWEAAQPTITVPVTLIMHKIA